MITPPRTGTNSPCTHRTHTHTHTVLSALHRTPPAHTCMKHAQRYICKGGPAPSTQDATPPPRQRDMLIYQIRLHPPRVSTPSGVRGVGAAGAWGGGPREKWVGRGIDGKATCLRETHTWQPRAIGADPWIMDPPPAKGKFQGPLRAGTGPEKIHVPSFGWDHGPLARGGKKNPCSHMDLPWSMGARKIHVRFARGHGHWHGGARNPCPHMDSLWIQGPHCRGAD